MVAYSLTVDYGSNLYLERGKRVEEFICQILGNQPIELKCN